MTNRFPLVETLARRMSGAHAAYVFSLRFASAVATVACAGMLAGCTTSGSPQEVSGTASTSTDGVASQATAAAAVEYVDQSPYDLEYSDRDLDASYNEASSTKIAFSEESAAVDGTGATADGSVVTISGEGTYIVSGSASDAQIVVAADADAAKVRIVLAGARIENEAAPAISVESAEQCVITLAEGTSNVLASGASAEDKADAVLYSTADLTLNGTGALDVSAPYGKGIHSTDGLVVTGGTYAVAAADDGLSGKDCVKIADGDLTVEAGADGIKSSNDEDEGRGFVSIDGGTLSIDAADDGIQAARYVRLGGGSVSVTAEDDGIHSDGDVALAGSTLTISAGDDGVHGEYVLEVAAGRNDVDRSEEGLEAQAIYVHGGETAVTSSDDGLNASTPEAEKDGSSRIAAYDPASPSDAEEIHPGGGGMASAEGFPGGMEDSDASCLIDISDGFLYVNAAGDGLDSNGNLSIGGGTTVVSGPEDGGNGALDYSLEGTYEGGTVLAVGSSGMAQGFSGASGAWAAADVDGDAGDTVSLVDAEGNVLASLASDKAFQSVIVASDKLHEGSEARIVVGGEASGASSLSSLAAAVTSGGVLSGGTATDVAASTSTTVPSGMGGGMPPGGPAGDRSEGGGGPTP
ncbi:carbohydrate-binding domain-containing protein [Slackia exigua]|uniref:carbohydrate-binding domain-containing protein n=1 Tax=Slackia exigua TaxID=84109 RepID=UPI00210BC508|nr:carbohydrate-binding domain-containing protein [Slackia exigua]MCQ5091707.1 carbohydrate-binding domain-containing protein [Slackia exigua]